MPPVRTMPPVKPVKTERTHAENQERAYIAASRRSDRSLEARVESARRASEIHKKRTGRSLRVTEADVINEEMYEEEDDDLPAQIRRITAHLQTGNDPFNRRLQSYVANHIAMRSALGQFVADNWQQQQMQNNHINQYLTPGMMQQQQNAQMAFQNTMMPPQMPAPQSPQSYRTSPYPLASGTPSAGRPNAHSRSASIATPQEMSIQQSMMGQQTSSAHSSPVDTKAIDRRFSLPAHPPAPRKSQSSSPDMSRQLNAAQPVQSTAGARPGPLNLSHPMFTAPFGSMNGMSFGPLTSTLPLESQQLLAGAPLDDLNDPAMAAMMQTHLVPTPGGSLAPAPGFYSYNPNGSKGKAKTASVPASTAHMGMNATLAPSVLDVVAPPAFPAMSNDESLFSSFTNPGFGLGFDSSQGDYPLGDGNMPSGQITPAETDWNMWLETQAFTEEPTAV